MTTEEQKKDNLQKLLVKLIEEEKLKAEHEIIDREFNKLAKATVPPKPKATVSFFEHVADVVVNWLLRKFFPTKTVMPKEQVEELKELRITAPALRKDVKAYEKITGNLKTLMTQGDYTRSFDTLNQLSTRYWTRMTPEAYKRLIETPDIRRCDHKKGFRWRDQRLSRTVTDYNIWDHRFIDGRREVRCLNHCGWKSEPGDANWPIALIMLKATTNTATASERPTFPPNFDPKLSNDENWANAGYEPGPYDQYGFFTWVKKAKAVEDKKDEAQ